MILDLPVNGRTSKVVRFVQFVCSLAPVRSAIYTGTNILWGRIEKVRTSKRVRYNTCLLANEPYRAKFCDAVSEALPEINTNASASERWSSVENIVKEAAESTIGLTAPTGRRDTPHCPEMAAMSAEQIKLKLWRQNTRDVNNKATIKRS